jgi:hypothetical protein
MRPFQSSQVRGENNDEAPAFAEASARRARLRRCATARQAEVRGQKSEVRSQKSEDTKVTARQANGTLFLLLMIIGRQRTEVRSQTEFDAQAGSGERLLQNSWVQSILFS